ncbi:hypothetical protein BASA81_002209 [Batrachochytrium salamandrivorans]|nr:hypothetical protein BASA81_002209 [Batrachochytrium salamandrivorans]
MFAVELVVESGGERERTLVDLESTLARLMHVSNSCLTEIESKVDLQRMRLTKLEHRLARCERAVVGSAGKSTKLFNFSSLPNTISSNPKLFQDFPRFRLGCEGKEYEVGGGGGGGERDPVIPVAVLDGLKERLKQQLDHKLALKAQTAPSSSHTIKPTTPPTLAEGVRTSEDDLGPVPVSLLRANLMLGSALAPATTTAATATAQQQHQHELSFHQQMMVMETSSLMSMTTPDSLGLPLDLTGVFAGVGKRRIKAQTVSVAVPIETAVESLPPAPVLVAPTAIAAATTSPVTRNTATTPAARNAPSADFLSAIREAKPLQPAKAATGSNTTTIPLTSKPKTLAEEMRDKLMRRQAMLSGDKDEEEQRNDRTRRQVVDDDAKSFISTSTIGPLPAPPARTLALKRQQQQQQVSSTSNSNSAVGLMPSFDRVFEREMSKKDLFHPVITTSTSSHSSEEDWRQ